MLVHKGSRFHAIAVSAHNRVSPVSKFGLGFPSVDKTNADDINDSRSICGEETRSSVEDKRIKIAVSLIVVCETLSVDGDLDLKDIWLCVLGSQALDKATIHELCLHVDVLARFVAESALKICTGVIEALEATTSHLDRGIHCGLNMAETWVEGSNVRGLVVSVAAVGGRVLNIMPVLVVEGNLQESILSFGDGWCRPLPGIN